jgi:hypothetical protein
MALPWMHATASTATSGGDSHRLDAPPVRTAFLFMPNGVNPKNWTPETIDGSDQYELTPMLRPLGKVKDELILLENLHHPNLNTFMFGNAQTGRNFSFIDGVTEGSFHGISHHRNEAKRIAQYEKIGNPVVQGSVTSAIPIMRRVGRRPGPVLAG